jgi:hypothetical protein
VTPERLHYVREACGEAIRLNLVLPAIAEELRNIDGVIRDGNYLALKNRPVALGALQKLYSVSKEIAPYRDAIQALALELDLTLDEGAVIIPPPVVSPPIVPNTSENFNAFEIQKLGDLNYRAREYLQHNGPVHDRLLVLAHAIAGIEGTWKTWADPDRSYIVSLMGSTDMGHDPDVRPILVRFALALGVVLTDVAFPSGQVITQPPVVTNPPPPAPPVTETPVSADSAELLAQLGAVGIFIDPETKCVGIGGPPLRERVTEGAKLPQIKLTLWASGASAIAYVANTSLSDPQRRTAANPKGDPQRYYVRIDSMGGDNGARTGENAVYGPNGVYVPDGYRNSLNSGTDSRKHYSIDETFIVPNPDGSGRGAPGNVNGQNEITYPHADFIPGNAFARCYGEPGQRPHFRWTRAGSPQSAFDDGVDLVALRDAVRALGGNV